MTRNNYRPLAIGLAAALAIAGVGAALVAQIEGERGVPPIASSGDYEVNGVRVDVYAANANAARTDGWRLAQRVAWKQLWGKMNGGAAPGLSDSQLDAIISGIEVEKEQAGPNRYIATLGVLFDRARAGQILGVRASAMRSAPLLVIPVIWEGGAAQVFETRTEWQKAWARFRIGDSAIDYVRTSGTGPDALLLNAAQTGRRSRTWWRVLLDQYGAADVIIPIARLERQYPGGPVIGRFAARYGPDNQLIATFDMRAANEAAVPEMMDKAVARMDQLYAQALMDGTLRPDPSLVIEEPVAPEDLGNAAAEESTVEVSEGAAVPVVTTGTYQVQYDTPNAGAVGVGESAVRGIAGVRSASTTSLALGGTSVMQVTFDGSAEALRSALQARGWSVSLSGNSLRISRGGGQDQGTERPAPSGGK